MKHLLSYCSFGILFAAFGCCGSFLNAAEKAPLPDLDQLDKAIKLVDEKFPSERDKKSGYLLIIQNLVAEVNKPQDDPVFVYALLIRIIQLATTSGDVSEVAASLREIDRRFEGDLIGTRSQIALETPKAAEHCANPTYFDAMVTQTIDRALAADRFDIAKKLTEFADEVAKKSKRASFKKAVQELSDKVSRQEKDYQSIADSVKTLDLDPTDAKSALAVGKFRCFVQKRWDVGLPLLAKGSDAELAKIAMNDLEKRNSPEGRKEIADGWRAYGTTSQAETQVLSRRRALDWYRESLLELKQQAQIADVTKRIAELEKALPIGAVPWDALLLYSFEPATYKRTDEKIIVRNLTPVTANATLKGADIGPGRAGKGVSLQPRQTVEFDHAWANEASTTIGLWVNARSWQDPVNGDYIFGDFDIQGMQIIFGKGDKSTTIDTGNAGRGLRLGPNLASFIIGCQDKWLNSRTRESVRFKTDTWYHLAGTYDGENGKLYVNGHLHAQEPFAGRIKRSLYGPRVAHIHAARNLGFDGTVDEIAVFDRALSAEEIDSLYRMGVAGKSFVAVK